MKKQLLTISTALLLGLGAQAQYYFGTPFYTEGFDTQAAFDAWTVESSVADTVTGHSPMWYIAAETPEGDNYSETLSTSTNSLIFKINEGDKVQSTITSPVIDVEGREGLVVGFSSCNHAWIYPSKNIIIYADVKAVDQTEWTEVYRTNTRGVIGGGWGFDWFQFFLSNDFNGKNIQIRFRVEATNYSGSGDYIAIDGVYISQKPDYDAQAVAVTPDGNGGFGNAETITFTIHNGGTKALTNIPVYYSINGGEAVGETFAGPIEAGADATYTFNTKADLSTAGATYTVKAWAQVADDADASNDAVEATASNTVTTTPYKPTFMDENGRANTDYWNDNLEDKNVSSRYWIINRDRNAGIGYWQVRSDNNATLSTHLVSRPIKMEGGKSYTLSFENFLEGSDCKGVLDVYYTQNADTAQAKLTHLINVSEIGTDVVKTSMHFTIAETGIYNLVFVARTPAANRHWLDLRNISVIEVYQYDAAIKGIIAPETHTAERGAAETVKVKVANNGIQPTEGMQLALSVNGRLVATEPVEAITSETEIEYTFQATADLSYGNNNKISVAIVWDKDQDLSNNETSASFTSDVVNVPYINGGYTNDFNSSYWTSVDANNDGLTIIPTASYGNYRMEYAASADAPATTTDEYLYSRAIRMKGGKEYHIESRMFTETPQGWKQGDESPNFYHVVIGLYTRSAEGEFTLVKTIDESDIYFSYDNYHHYVEVENDGVYYIGWHITKDAETTYYFRLNEMYVYEANDADIQLDRVKVAGTNLSAYNTIPARIEITNMGKEAISNFTLKVSSPAIGEKEIAIALEEPLAPYASRTIYLTENIQFPATEEVKFEAVLEGDGVNTNNTQYLSFTVSPSVDVPATFAMQDGQGWLTLNNDNNYDEWDTASYYSGYHIDVTNDAISDQLISQSMNLKGGKTYQLSFEYELKSDFGVTAPLFRVSVVNCATLEATTIAVISCENGYSNYEFDQFTGYFSVAADGEYSIMYEDLPIESDGYSGFDICGNTSVSEVTTAPDFELTAITAPAEDAIFTEAETVTATYKNAGEETFSSVPFTLTVGDNTYYTIVREAIAAGAEGTVTFNNVNLFEPGDYALTVAVPAAGDATPENNTIVKNLKSMPIVDMVLVSIDAPKSGGLTQEEQVVITVKNNGKGALSNIPVSYSIKDAANAEAEAVVVNEVIEVEIAQDSTYQYTFTTFANLARETTYDIVATVAMEADTCATNNSITTKVSSTQKAIDAGATAVVGPTDRLMTNEEYLIVTVKNYGEGYIYDVPVTATVTQGETVVGTVTGLVAEIAPESSVDYTFTTAVDLSNGGTFNVAVETTINNDVNAENNKAEGTVYGYVIDCGVESIVSPEFEIAAGQHDITVVIKNFGDVDVTDVPVFYKTGNMPQTGLYEGTIAAGESATYTFSTKYNFRADRQYTLTAYTEYATDMRLENDTCSMQIKVVSGIADASADGTRIYAANNAVVVECNDTDATIAIYDAQGRLVAQRVATETRTIVALNEGMYIVRVAGTETNKSTKVLIKYN